MNVYFPTRLGIAVGTVCGVALAAGLAMLARADEWNKRTIVTVNQPIQVSEKLLEPGQYVFKLLDSNSDRHIVQIFNGDQTRLVDTIMAIPNDRLTPTGDSRFAFWETPPGDARALRAWFYPGDNFGQEFRYPSHLTVLEASVRQTTVPQETTASRETTEVTTKPAEPPPAPMEEKKVEEKTEIAQAAPPPPEATPEAPPAPPPTSLPKTGSLYPLIGISGLFSLALFGLLRLRRSA